MKEKDIEEDEESLLSPVLLTTHKPVTATKSLLAPEAASGKRSGHNVCSPTFDKKLKRSKRKKLIDPLNCNFFLDAKSSATDEAIKSNVDLCVLHQYNSDCLDRKHNDAKLTSHDRFDMDKNHTNQNEKLVSKTEHSSAKRFGSKDPLVSKIENLEHVMPGLDFEAPLIRTMGHCSPELVSLNRASPIESVSPEIQTRRINLVSIFDCEKNIIPQIHNKNGSLSLEAKEDSLEDCPKTIVKSSSSSTDIIEASDGSNQDTKTTVPSFRCSRVNPSLPTDQKFNVMKKIGASPNANVEETSFDLNSDIPNLSPVFEKKISFSRQKKLKAMQQKLKTSEDDTLKKNKESIFNSTYLSNDNNSILLPNQKIPILGENFESRCHRSEPLETEDLNIHISVPTPRINSSPSEELNQTTKSQSSVSKLDCVFIRSNSTISPEYSEENASVNCIPNLSGARKRLGFHSYSSEKKRTKSIKPVFKLKLKKTNHVESQFIKFSQFCKLNSSLSTKSPSNLTTRKSKMKKFDLNTDESSRVKKNFEYSENCDFNRSPSPVLQPKIISDLSSCSIDVGHDFPPRAKKLSDNLQICQDTEMKLEETEDFILEEPVSPVLKTRKKFDGKINTPETPRSFNNNIENVSKRLLFSHKNTPSGSDGNYAESHLDSNRVSPILNQRIKFDGKSNISDFISNFSEIENSLTELKVGAEKETVFSENKPSGKVSEFSENSLSPVLKPHKKFNLEWKTEATFERSIGDCLSPEADDIINTTHVTICDSSILDDGKILNETVLDRNPEAEQVNVTINNIVDDEVTCSQVIRSISNQCSMDIEVSESSATQQSRISDGNLPCDDVKVKESRESAACTPKNKQRQIDDAVYESGKKRKRRYKNGTLSARLNRLLNRTRSETRMWAHEQQDESPSCLSFDLIVEKVAYEMNKWLLKCRISSCLDTDPGGLSYFVFLDPFTINNALVTPGAMLKIFPKWQTLDLSSPKVTVVFNVTRVKLVKQTSATVMPEKSVSIGERSSCLENAYCSCPRGNGWKLIQGDKEGQTQVDDPIYDEYTWWCHPLDVHFATKGIQGWPKLHVQVYHYDKFGRREIYGYGFCNVPTSPGTHQITCSTWRPVGGLKDQITQYFLGGGAQLRMPDVIYTGLDRYKLQTEAMGLVHIELGIILRNFDKYGVEF